MITIDTIWARIKECEGEVFTQLGGNKYSYSVTESVLRPSTVNQNLAKSQFEKAIEFLPLEGPGQINHLRGPSYIYSILMDDRIRRGDW